jgi:hypothetical protein
MLLGSIGWVQYGLASTTSTPPWTLNAPPTSAYNAYVGQYANGTYFFEKGDWQTWYNSANASQVINFALGNLTSGRTWQEKVYINGNFSITNTILVPSYTFIHIDGRITLATNANCDIIQNLNQDSNDQYITIEGGVLDGNKANQSGDSIGIYFKCVNVVGLEYSQQKLFILRDLTVRQCNLKNILIDFTGSYLSNILISNVKSTEGRYGEGVALQFKTVFDSTIEYGTLDGGYVDLPNTYSLYMEDCSYILIDKVYINANVGIINSGQIDFSPQIVDTALNGHSITLQGVTWSNFHDFTINSFNNDGTANTYDGIYMTNSSTLANCTNNIFDSIRIGRGDRTDYTRTFRYGVNEATNGQDTNIYCNIQGGDCATAALLLKGVASKSLHQNIVGNVTES